MAATKDPNSKPIAPIHSDDLQELSDEEKRLETHALPRCGKCLTPSVQTDPNEWWCIRCARSVHSHPTRKPREMRLRTENRFWSKISIREPDQCWPWQAGTYQSGYGAFRFQGGSEYAHRVALVLDRGLDSTDDLPGDCVRHTCHNKQCCNPKHLQPGTDGENNREAVQEGERNLEFTPHEVREIRRLSDKPDVLQKDIAANYGTTPQRISRIVRGDVYAWVE